MGHVVPLCNGTSCNDGISMCVCVCHVMQRYSSLHTQSHTHINTHTHTHTHTRTHTCPTPALTRLVTKAPQHGVKHMDRVLRCELLFSDGGHKHPCTSDTTVDSANHCGCFRHVLGLLRTCFGHVLYMCWTCLGRVWECLGHV